MLMFFRLHLMSEEGHCISVVYHGARSFLRLKADQGRPCFLPANVHLLVLHSLPVLVQEGRPCTWAGSTACLPDEGLTREAG